MAISFKDIIDMEKFWMTDKVKKQAEEENLKWMTEFFTTQKFYFDPASIGTTTTTGGLPVTAPKQAKPTREVKSIRELYNYGPDEVKVAKPATQKGPQLKVPLEYKPTQMQQWMWQGIPVTKTIYDALEAGPDGWGNHGKFSNHPNCTCVWESQQYVETTNLHFTTQKDESAPIMEPMQYIYTWKWLHHPCKKHIGLNNL